jgi:TP901 family phage tail tape measure protein
MAKIQKADILDDKIIIKAFNDVNEALKLTSKQFLDTAKDAVKLQNALADIKGFSELIEAQKKYGAIQKDAATAQKALLDLQAKEVKLREATAKALLAEQKIKDNVAKSDAAATRAAEKTAKDLAKQTSLYAQLSKAHIDARNTAKELAIQYGLNSKEYKKAAEEANKLDKQLKEIDSDLGQNTRHVGNYERAWGGVVMIWAAVGAAALAFGQKILDININFEKASASLRAITGATKQDMLFYEAQAKSMGTAFGIAADEMLKSFERVGSIRPELLKTKEALVQVTASAIVLSQASGGMLDLAGATEALGAGMNQFNLSAKDSDRIINALAAGSQIGSAEVASLAEAFKNVGAVANNANMSLEDTVASLEVLGEKSIYGAEAGTKLRGVIMKLQEAGKGFASGKFNLKDALIETKDALDDIANPIDKAAYLSKMFGIENQTAGIIMVQNIDKYTAFREGVESTNVAFEQQKIQMDTVSGAASRFGAAWSSFWTAGWVATSTKYFLDFSAWVMAGRELDQVSDNLKAFNSEVAKLKGEGKSTSEVIEILSTKLANGLASGQYMKGAMWVEQWNDQLGQMSKALNDQKDSLIVSSFRQELASKTASELSASTIELSQKLKDLNKQFELQVIGMGGIEKVSQGEIDMTKLKIRAIDEEIAARKKLEEEPSTKMGLSEAQIKINLEATKKYKAESDKIAEDFFTEWERVEKINIKTSEDAKEQKLKDEKEYQAASLKQSEDFLDEAMRQEQNRLDKEAEQAKLISDTKKQIATDAWNTGKQLVDTMFEIQQSNYDKEAKQVEDKYKLQENALKKQLDNDQLTVESRAQIEGQIKGIEAQKAKDLEVIEKKKKESQRKQFEINRAIAIAEIAMNTAQAIMKTYANVGAPWAIPLIVAAGALGAVQAGIVLAQPIPAFDKGTKNAPSTPFIVGEVAPEFVTKNGKTQLVTEPTIMQNMGGAVVTSSIETQKILQENQKLQVWSYLNKKDGLLSSQLLQEQKETNRLLKLQAQRNTKVVVNTPKNSFADMANSNVLYNLRK